MPRKRRGGRTPHRKGPKRAPYSKVLISTEGCKTEPNYFKGLIQHSGINTANVTIDGSGGSSPSSVLETGLLQYERSKTDGDPYDKVFLVFDKDDHSQYAQALDQINRQTPKNVFIPINSVPCFEYWLLLHFEYSTKPYHATGNKTAADKVCQELCLKLPNYDKNQQGLYSLLHASINSAKTNARNSLAQAQAAKTDNPTTKVHLLVEYLHNMKNHRAKLQ